MNNVVQRTADLVLRVVRPAVDDDAITSLEPVWTSTSELGSWAPDIDSHTAFNSMAAEGSTTISKFSLG